MLLSKRNERGPTGNRLVEREKKRERKESRDDSPGASRRRPRAATTVLGDEEEG